MNLGLELENKEYYKEIVNDYIRKDKKFDLKMNVSDLVFKLKNHYKWDYPRLVKIPKDNGGYRDIFIFNELDSFSLKVINSIFTKLNDNKISNNVFSYRKGSRCFNAGQYVRKGLINNNLVGMKIDISNYFQSVPREIILKSVYELVEDDLGRQLLERLYDINKVYYKDEIKEEYLGIMPGSALASFMANYILKDIDNIMINKSEIYARYSDDIVIFANNKEELKELENTLVYNLSLIGLSVKEEKIQYYHNDDVITFLGLDITKDYIDVSEKSYKAIRRVIKQKCEKQRKLLETGKIEDKELAIRKAIQSIYNTIYYSLVSDKIEHKGGRIQYIFSSITRTDKLKQLDFYMLDTLRYVYSGKHNKGTVKILDTRKLESLGFIPFVKMFHLYKKDKDICINEASILLNRKVGSRKYINTMGLIQEEISYKEITTDVPFSLFYNKMLNTDSYFIIGKVRVLPEHLEFDLDKKEVRLLDKVIIQGNRVIEPIYCYLTGDYCKVTFTLNKISHYTEVIINDLYSLYIRASYKRELGLDWKIVKNYKVNFPFRTYSLDLLTRTYNNLDTEVDRDLRVARFMSYLYFHIQDKVLWEELDYNRNFIKYSRNGFSLILKKQWFE